MSIQRNRVRIEQTRRELDRLRAEIEDWLARRIKADERKQYQTQLNVLGTILTTALSGVQTALDGVSPHVTGAVYSTCRLYDRRLVWVRRLWEYFRRKFDQRDDTQLGPVLAAADEVVWSCYAGAFQNAQASLPQLTRGSAPLPYIEPRYSPQAIPRAEPPPDLKSEVDSQFVQDFLAELPIPVVSLPPSCVTAPWWLIYLGHEVGHHVQYDLLPQSQLVGAFGQLLASAVKAEPEGHDKTAQRWEKWKLEIFADVFSVFNMGGWAVWAMTELEMADEPTMFRSKPLYPSSVVRLALMSAVADKLGLDGRAALRGLNPQTMVTGPPVFDENKHDLRQLAALDLKFVSGMAAAVVKQSLGGAGRFEQLCDWRREDFMDDGAVYHWKEGFSGREPLAPELTLRAARLAVSGALAAWAEVSVIEDTEQRAEAQAKLVEDVLPMIAQSREEGTRAAEPPPPTDVEQFGDKLARLLLEAGPETLGE
jgi:hypothetical protein